MDLNELMKNMMSNLNLPKDGEQLGGNGTPMNEDFLKNFLSTLNLEEMFKNMKLDDSTEEDLCKECVDEDDENKSDDTLNSVIGDEKNDTCDENVPGKLNNLDLDLDNLDFNNLDFSKLGLGNFDFGNLLSMFNFPVSDEQTVNVEPREQSENVETNEEETTDADPIECVPDVISEPISSPSDENIEDYLN